MDKGKTGMKRKQLYRKVCACKYLSEKKAPATLWVLRKKLKKIRRQNHALQVEIQNLRDKNRELASSVVIEKHEQSKLKDENNELKSRYHNLSVNYNSTKEELIRAHQLITKVEEDISLAFTRVVKFSEGIAFAKSRIGEYFSFTQSKFHKGKDDNEVSRKHSLSPIKDYRCGVPVKQRVGPMVKGYPITKPKIMLKRISVPVQQELGDLEETDSGDTSNDAAAVPQLTPVLEEEESVVSGPELSVTQTHKTGFRYRLHPIRNDDRNNNSTSNNNEEPASVIITCDSVGDSTDNCGREPVVRLHNMRQIYTNMSPVFEINGPNFPLHVIESGSGKTREERGIIKEGRRQYNGSELNQESKHNSGQSRSLKRASEDPLEGCSWMYNTHSKRKYVNRKRRNHPKRKLYFEGRPVYSSDDSLSDEENVHELDDNIHGSLVCKGNNTVNTIADEGRVEEPVPLESFVCPYYDPKNPKHNNDRKLCNSCETCVGLQITTRPRSKVNKKVVEHVVHVLRESENNDSEILGFSKKSNSWVCNSSDKKSNRFVISCKTDSLTPEENDNFQISKDVHTSTPEPNEKSPPSKGVLPNVVLQRLEPELSLCETVCADNNTNFSYIVEYVKDNDSVDLNKNVKLKSSLELNGSVSCVEDDISGESGRKSGRKSSLRKQRRKSSVSKRLPTSNTRRRSKRLSESGSRTIDNESTENSSGIMTSRPRRNVNKVSYKQISLRKKLRRQ